jgi:hypothetical protein
LGFMLDIKHFDWLGMKLITNPARQLDQPVTIEIFRPPHRSGLPNPDKI